MIDAQLPVAGSIVAGKYRVERALGAGGMGAVFAVRHLGLDEPRALKLMLPRGLELPQARERFFREARAAAKLRSEHAVKIHDVAVSPEGFPYIEMELLEGADLASIIKRSGAVPVAHAARWIAEACEPLGEAHALGIVHRDLKPGNLFLARRRGGGDCMKVLDFGIAKTLNQLESDPSLTGTNASFGSPLYMSPEQMRGARFAEPRSDLWALGVVLYELVTGRRPFHGESATALALVVTGEDPTPPRVLRPDLPPAVEAVILGCLAKHPDARPATAAALAAALREALPAVFEPRPSMASVPAFLSPPSSPFPLSGAAPPQGPPLGLAPGAHGTAGASGSPASIASSAPAVAAAPPGPASFGGMSTQDGVPSQPTVATLSSTVGRRASTGNALLIGGAVTAAALGAVLGVVLWRAAPPRDDATTSTRQRELVEPPAEVVAADPAPGAELAPPGAVFEEPVASAAAPASPAPSDLDDETEHDSGGPRATGDAGPSTPGGAARPEPAAPGPTGATATGAATAVSSASAPRPPIAPSSSGAQPPPRARPKTGFGGID